MQAEKCKERMKNKVRKSIKRKEREERQVKKDTKGGQREGQWELKGKTSIMNGIKQRKT